MSEDSYLTGEIMATNAHKKVFDLEYKTNSVLSKMALRTSCKQLLEKITYRDCRFARMIFVKNTPLLLILLLTCIGFSETKFFTAITQAKRRINHIASALANKDVINFTMRSYSSYDKINISTADTFQSERYSRISYRSNNLSNLKSNFNTVSNLTAKIIYVDKDITDDCTDYDPNTRSCGSGIYTAYNTLNEAAAVAVAGDTVLIRQGLGVSPEYREQLAPANSGNAENGYITFKGFPGEDVRIKGDRIPAVSTGIMLNNRSYIVIDGLNVRYVKRYIRAENARHIIIRNNIFTGAVWAGAAMKFLNAHYNKIINNTITNSRGRTTDSIAFMNGNFNLLEGNTIKDGGHALFAVRGGNYNVIRNNYFYNSRQKIGEIYDYGIDYNSTKYNLVECNIFAFTPSSGSASPYAGIQFAGQNTIIRRNIWYDNIGGGLRLALYGKEGNYIIGNRIFHNVFYKNHHGGIHIGLGTTSMQLVDNIFKNNILYKNDFEARDKRWSWWVTKLDGKPIQLKTARLRGIYFERNNITDVIPFQDYIITHGFRNPSSPPHNPLNMWQTQYPTIFYNNLEVDPGFVDEAAYDFRLIGTSQMIDAGVFLTSVTSPEGFDSQITVEDAGYFYDGYGIEGEQGDLIKFENGQTARIIDIDYSAGSNTIILDRQVSWSNGEKVSLYYEGSAPDIGAYEGISSGTDNSPPILQPIGDKSVSENVILTFEVKASDPNGDPITYSAQNLPRGATFINQIFSWTPSDAQAGSYQVRFLASDGISYDSETITVTVHEVNRAPILGVIN